MADIDPLAGIDQDDYEDPNPEPINDPDHPDYCEPAAGIAPLEA